MYDLRRLREILLNIDPEIIEIVKELNKKYKKR